MDDVPISGKLGNGIRKYELGTVSKHLPVVKEYRKALIYKERELNGLEFEFDLYV